MEASSALSPEALLLKLVAELFAAKRISYEVKIKLKMVILHGD